VTKTSAESAPVSYLRGHTRGGDGSNQHTEQIPHSEGIATADTPAAGVDVDDMPLSASTRPSGASEPPEPGTGPTDGQDGSQRDVEPPPVLRARAREAEPYVHAETVTASDGTLIHIWAPRSCCERPRQPVPVTFEGERGRR
jgi:hypothetical protein